MNVIVWEKVGEQYKDAVFYGGLLVISGTVQKEGDVVQIIARAVTAVSGDLS